MDDAARVDVLQRQSDLPDYRRRLALRVVARFADAVEDLAPRHELKHERPLGSRRVKLLKRGIELGTLATWQGAKRA